MLRTPLVPDRIRPYLGKLAVGVCALILALLAIGPAATPAAAAACYPDPSSCGYPDATTTGASGDLAASGSITASTPGQVIEDKHITGQVTINADNVTLRNVRVTATISGSGSFAIRAGSHTGLKILDTTVEGQGPGEQTLESALNGGEGVLIERSNFTLCSDCVEYGSPTIRDTYMKVSSIYSGAHAEDIYVCSESVHVEHSTLINEPHQTATVFGDTICGGGNNFNVTDSLLAGGGFLVYPQANSSTTTGTMNISGNRFARCLTKGVYDAQEGGTDCSGGPDISGLYPYGGYYGVAAYFYTGSGQVWQNNVWDDNSQPVCANGSSGCGTASPPPPPPTDIPAVAVWTAPSGVQAGTPVTLNGSASTGDTPIGCVWSIEDQGGAVLDTRTGCRVTYTFQAGTQYVKLTVTDGDGDTNSSRKSFPVADPTTPPPADTPAEAVWTAPTEVEVGIPVVLDGTESGGTGATECTWSFEDASGNIVWETHEGCVLNFTFQQPGVKYVQLTVVDESGDSDSSRQSFPVTTPTESPPPPPDVPAKAVWSAPTGAKVGAPVTLNGSSSTGDAPISCAWSFETQAGTVNDTRSGCSVSYTFQQAGTQYVRLTVTDGDGDINSSRKSFSVAPASTTPPVDPPEGGGSGGGSTDPPPSHVPARAIWAAPDSIRGGQRTVFDGTASEGDRPLSCIWTTRERRSSGTTQFRQGCRVSFTFRGGTTQYVTLTINAADGSTDSLRRTIDVRGWQWASPSRLLVIRGGAIDIALQYGRSLAHSLGLGELIAR